MFRFLEFIFRKKKHLSDRIPETESMDQRQTTAFEDTDAAQNGTEYPQSTFVQREDINAAVPKQSPDAYLESANDMAPQPASGISTNPSTSRRRLPRGIQQGTGNVVRRRTQKSSVYIGLDFGTTFTKAAYEIAPSNVHMKHSVKFGSGSLREDYYLPSVLLNQITRPAREAFIS